MQMNEKEDVRAFCARMDHGGCGVLVRAEKGLIKEIKGDPECPINLGKLCPKGKAAIDQIYHPDRLLYPLMRTGARGSGKWRRISWNRALAHITERIMSYRAEYGAESIIFAQGAPRGLEYLMTFRLARALGTPNVVTTGAVCFAPRWGAGLITCGFYPKPDIERSRCIIIWGNNALDTSADSTFGFQLKRVVNKGVPIIVIDPKRTALARRAHMHLAVKPGADGALALGMLNVLIEEKIYDQSFVNRWIKGFEELREHLIQFTPEKVSELTWIPTDMIKKAARFYANTKPASILWGNGPEQNANAVQTNRALVTLMAVTGNLDVPGGNMDCAIPSVRSPGEFVLTDKFRELKGRMIGGEYPMARRLGFVPSTAAVRAMLTEDPYPVKMLLLNTSNPLVSYANSKRVYEALNRIEFLVVTELFMTPTAALADIVLPAATNYEFNELGHYGLPFGSIHARPAIIIPRGECRSDIAILNELGGRLGLKEYFWENITECLDYILEPSGHDFDSFKEVSILHPPQEYRKYERNGFRTPSGKIEVYSERMKKWGHSPLPSYNMTPATNGEYPHLMSSCKDLPYFHTSMRNLPGLRRLMPDPVVQIHPALAKYHGLEDGDEVLVENVNGTIKQRVRINPTLDERVIYCSYGWWFPERGNQGLYGWDESNINMLTDDTSPLDPSMGTTMQRAIPCRIRKIMN